ncbi:MAG: ATP-dependent helicase [Euryarchaeota archaeon]|nr:ATP-dependent helicase [Euryarchaeota archaeon]
MIHHVRRKWNKSRIISLFDPLIGEWFSSKYSELTEPQSYGIPLIHSGKNVLVSSPTGSGKTLTAFISIINELFLMSKSGDLEDKIYCVYISPLKALANDINRNLETPLAEIMDMAKKEKIKVPKIRVAVRSGDTSTSERQKMLRRPPHILITTPESLALMLTAPKFREKFKTVRYVIVDEIHELANNKRGVLLSLNLERLANYAGEFQRIGLSATQAPIEEIARYLAGLKNGKERDIWIVQPAMRKDMELRVLTPVEDLTMVPYEVATEKMYDILVSIIKEHRTTLIFTNTRSGAEHVAYKLKERGIDSIEAHHGSLSKETRLRVEKDLKDGNLKCVISSTSLELGIDIGYIDIVVQIGSPKSVAKALQRIGRSGHAYGKKAKGVFMVFELDDLIECATLVKCAYEGKIDRIRIPENSLDVLAQVLVGMSLEQRWNVDAAYALVRNSYCYRNLPKEKFLEVLRYLGGKVMGNEFYSKLWYDEEEGVFGKKRSSRMIYFMNIGTIPDESDYLVVDIEGKRLGTLSEKFVEKLQRGDVFVLGARSYEVLKLTSTRVVVRNVAGKRPTVPSWAGEMLPRSFDLSVEVGKFREYVENLITEKGVEKAIKTLRKTKYLDGAGAKSVVSYIREQMHHGVPTHRMVVIEGYVEPGKKHNIIFHFPFGRRVNDALSRAYAHAITEKYGTNVGVSITDDAFMLTLKRKISIKNVLGLITEENLENMLKEAIFNTEMFKQRFRHVATRAFMVLRRYKGRNISVARQQLRSDKILKLLRELPGFPVMEETFNEILNIAMDLPHALEIVRGMENGTIQKKFIDYTSTPSVFAHSIILVGISDIVLMEDRSTLLKELHMKLLEKIIPESEIEAMFTEEEVNAHFAEKIKIKDERTMLQFMKLAPGADILHRRGVNIYDYSALSEEDTLRLAEKLVNEGKIVSVFTTRVLWTHVSMYPVFATLYARECSEPLKWDGAKSVEELAKEFNMKKADVMEKLKCMERAYLAGRKIADGKTLWYTTESGDTLSRDYAMELLIKNLLYFRAPLTFDEIVYTLHLPEEDVRRVLKYMVEEGTVLKGKFLVGYGEQYMLTEDYQAIMQSKGTDEETLWKFRTQKITKNMNCDEYFKNFLVLFNTDSLKIRGCFDEFIEMVKHGELAYGRFMGGRLCYAPKKSIPLFAAVYRRDELTERDRRILNLIGGLGDEATLKKVQSYSNYSASEVKKIIDKLERNIYIYRHAEPHLSPQRYHYDAVVYAPEGTQEEFIKRVIKGYGPLSPEEIEWYTGLKARDLNVKTITVEGRTYLSMDEIKDAEGTTKIVPREDPLIYPTLHSLYGRFEEILTHMLVENGVPAATGEIVNKKDYFSVGDIHGHKRKFLETVCELGTVVLSFNPRVKAFHKIGDFYVCGELSHKLYEKKQIIQYLLWKNRVLPGRKLKNPLEVVRFMMYLHSDRELIRAVRKISLSKYYTSNLIYETVNLTGSTVYSTLDNIALFQSIKRAPLDENMRVILRMFERAPSMRTAEILQESPLGEERTRRALNQLYRGNYLARHSSGYHVVRTDMPQEYAKQAFVEKLMDIFGFLSVEIIEQFTGEWISTTEIINILKLLNKHRGLYLNDGHIYYTDENEIESFTAISETVILDPKDPLSEVLRRLFPQKCTGYLVIFGDRVECVKATGKRKIRVQKASSPEAEQQFLRYFTP